MNKEIQKLHTTLKEIENLDLPNMKKDPKYFWEHELGWLDYWYEIQLIERENMKAKFDLPRISDEDKASIINAFSDYCKFYNKRWWPEDPKTRNVGEAIALMHAELSEALEGHRKNLQDSHLPQFKALSVELADCLIRIFDFAETFAPDLGEAFIAKMAYNQIREDHKIENRIKEHGKKY